MATKPTLVLVPGSFCFVAAYANIIEAFEAKGYSLVPLDLRTVGKKPGPLPTVYDDAAYINAEVTKLADQGKEVVLVGHSYGGIPVSESLKGITKSAREKEGKKGGVVRVAYLTALVPGLGENSTHVLEPGAISFVTPDEEGWLHHQDLETTAKIVFSDLPLEEGIKWSKVFTQHSSVAFANELTYQGYKDVPASFLFCEGDQCLLPKTQQRSIDNIEKASGRKVDVTRIPNDHVPNVSAPEKVVDWFVHLVEKGGKE